MIVGARVLILEDDPQWVHTLEIALEHEVEHLAIASTVAAALDLWERRYFNLAIVDVSLRHGDNLDTQGMQFLAALHERYKDVFTPCIMFSAYGNVERVRQAFRKFSVADWVEKSNFSQEKLLNAVGQALAERNLGCKIAFTVSHNRRLPDLWAGFNWPQREDPFQLEPELNDLFLRLFPGATKLFIQDLATGQSGAGVLKVTPTFGNKVGIPVAVKFGKREKIDRERENFRDYIEKFTGIRSSIQLDHAAGRVMAAISYQLIGTELDEVASFGRYYCDHSVAQIKQALDNLFLMTCGRWYDNREQPKAVYDLVDLYADSLHLRWDEVWPAAESSMVDISGDGLLFPGLAGDLPNPRRWLERRDYSIERLTWRCTTHGDLNENNIFVTDDNRCWLIDFYRTGVNHILSDLIELETAIKFNLTPIDRLADQAVLEKWLVCQRRIDVLDLPSEDHVHYKPLAVIGHLRRLADNFTGADKDMEEYNVGLLLTTLKYLSLEGLDTAKRQRALLSAAMLCEALDK